MAWQCRRYGTTGVCSHEECQPVPRDEHEHLKHEAAVLRAALGEIMHEADELLAGSESAIRHAEQCTECGLGGVGPLRDALRKARGLERRAPTKALPLGSRVAIFDTGTVEKNSGAGAAVLVRVDSHGDAVWYAPSLLRRLPDEPTQRRSTAGEGGNG